MITILGYEENVNYPVALFHFYKRKQKFPQ